MDWCTKNSYSENPSDNIGRCVLHSTNLACTQSANVIKEFIYIYINNYFLHCEFQSTFSKIK
jgi:hypothetical protein